LIPTQITGAALKKKFISKPSPELELPVNYPERCLAKDAEHPNLTNDHISR
jgi:hypothetical protein